MTRNANNNSHELHTASSLLMVPFTLALGLTGCALDSQDLAGSDVQAIGLPGLPENGLPQEGLPDNGLPQDGLPDNGLSSSTLSLAWEAWLTDPTRGDINATLMGYIVRCALDNTQTASFTDSSGYTWVWQGEIGVATSWQTTGITLDQRRWVTSCVLSLVNKNGQTVQISQRGSTTSPYSNFVAELAVFSEREGAFFGDMFATTPTYFSCSALANPTQRSDGRVCTTTDAGGNSVCAPIEALGTCSDICDAEIRLENNKTYTVYTNCDGADGVTYSQVTNTALEPEQE